MDTPCMLLGYHVHSATAPSAWIDQDQVICLSFHYQASFLKTFTHNSVHASTLNNRTSVAHHLGKARNDGKPLWSKIIKTTDTNRNNMMRKNEKKNPHCRMHKKHFLHENPQDTLYNVCLLDFIQDTFLNIRINSSPSNLTSNHTWKTA